MIFRKNIDKIITETLHRYILESLNNNDSPLYRWTDLDGLFNIISTDSMKSSKHEGYNWNDNVQTTHNGICFTRNKRYVPYDEYSVQMVFSPQTLLNNARGVELIPYQDKRFEGLDEYEERLVSKNGKNFELKPMSKLVNGVYVHIDKLIEEVFENRNTDYQYMIDDINSLLNHNIFGDKLKFVYNKAEVVINNIEDFKKFVAKQTDLVYCVETYDVDEEEYDEYDYYEDEQLACEAAKRLHDEDEINVRVVEYYGDDMMRICCEF